MEPSSSRLKPREVQLERSQELRTRVTNNVLYILRERVGMTQAKALINVWGLGYADYPDLIIMHSMHVANIHKYAYCVHNNEEGWGWTAWKSGFAWSVYLDLCHTDRRWSILSLSLFERSTEQRKAFISVLGCVPHTLVPCSVSAEGGYHAEDKNSLPLLQACPSCAPHPAFHPLEQLCLMFLFQNPLGIGKCETVRVKAHRRVLVNTQDDQDTHACT